MQTVANGLLTVFFRIVEVFCFERMRGGGRGGGHSWCHVGGFWECQVVTYTAKCVGAAARAL